MLPRSPLNSPTSLVRRRKSRWRLSGRRCGSSLSRRFSTFQPSRNDQAIFLSLKIPLARLIDVSKVVNRNRRPRKMFFLSSSFSAVLSETMTTKPAHTHVYIFWVVHLLACWISIKHCQKRVFSQKYVFWTTNDAILFKYPLRICAHPYILTNKMAV